MTAPAVIFWGACLLIGYTYFGYPMILWLLGMRRASRMIHIDRWPSVSLVIPAYNEGNVIRAKILNCLALDYPKDQLEIIIVSDASTDETDAIVQEYETAGVRLIRQPVRCGKEVAQNTAVAESHGEILVPTDANSLCEPGALRRLIAPFVDPRVGSVVGRVRHSNPYVAWVSLGEALYWRYEGALKEAQAAAGALLFGVGALTAIRRSLFRPVHAPWQDQDTLMPLLSQLAGYRVVYARDAVAWEDASTKGLKEFQRKMRIIMRDAKTFLELKLLLWPLRPWLAFNLLSSKVLRWMVGLLLSMVLVANILLLEVTFYRLTLAMQIGFYSFAFVGLTMQRINRRVPIFWIPAYFCLVNAAAIAALTCVLAGRSVRWTWEPRGG